MPPMTAHKAVAATVAGFAVPVLTWLSAWLLSGAPWEWRQFAASIAGSALTALGAGGLTYAIPNQPKTIAAGLENAHSPNMKG